MMCYLDKTFCEDTDRCSNEKCDRRMTNEVINKSDELGLAICVAKMAQVCDAYEEIDNRERNWSYVQQG